MTRTGLGAYSATHRLARCVWWSWLFARPEAKVLIAHAEVTFSPKVALPRQTATRADLNLRTNSRDQKIALGCIYSPGRGRGGILCIA